MPVALFGITNEGLNLAVNLLVLFLVVVWIALVVWTYLDSRRRLDDPVLVASATVASLFPFVGTMVYSILRPPEYSADRRERELEIRAAELRVRQLEEQSCPNCGYPVERNYLRCPECRARVKDPCDSCGKPIDPRWSVCPYCETPVKRAAAPQPRRTSAAQRRAKSRTQTRPSRESGRATSRSAASSTSSSPRQGASAARKASGAAKQPPADGNSQPANSKGAADAARASEAPPAAKRPAAPRRERPRPSGDTSS